MLDRRSLIHYIVSGQDHKGNRHKTKLGSMRLGNMNIRSRLTISILLIMAALSGNLAGARLDPSNAEAIFDVAASGDAIFAGGAGRLYVSQNGGLTWAVYDTTNGFGKGMTSAIALTDTAVWVATYYDTTLVGKTVFVNGGLFKSPPQGVAWEYIAVLFRLDPGNITYDIAVDGATLWTANWWRSLQRSDDGGLTWQQVVPDSTTYYNPAERLNQRLFAVAAEDSIIWTGSQDGLNLSIDNGATWRQIRHAGGATDISGNKVVAVSPRRAAGVDEVWAATWTTFQGVEKNGVSISADTGRTWRIVLSGQQAWNFLFHDSDIFVACNSGLWRTHGDTAAFVNVTTGILAPGTDVYTVAMTADSSIWIGTEDGLYHGNYAGSYWEKVDMVVLDADDGQTMLPSQVSLGRNYPNPFNPTTVIPLCLPRAEYVSLELFDLLGRRIRTLVSATLPAGLSHISWDGCDDSGHPLSGGVYFYRLTAGQTSQARSMILLK